jgi:hypothetical protein
MVLTGMVMAMLFSVGVPEEVLLLLPPPPPPHAASTQTAAPATGRRI